MGKRSAVGCSMRTERFRYTEYVRYDPVSFQPFWNETVAIELYDHEQDPWEYVNVAERPEYEQRVKALRKKLRLGWKHSRPGSNVNHGI